MLEPVDVRLPEERDLRLDLFRGLANWFIFFGHIPATMLAWLTTRNYGFSDGADLFVFISGYTATLVYARMMIERGVVIGATRLWRRVWQLYVAQLLLFLFYTASVHYLAHRLDVAHLMDEFNVAWLMSQPVETVTEALILKFKPLNLDVLPLYIVLMAAFPPILWLMLQRRHAVLAGSVLLNLAARYYRWNLPSYPAGEWYFDPFTWQLVFVLGAWLALGGTPGLHRVVRSRVALALSIGYVIFALAMTLSGLVPELQGLFPAGLRAIFVPNDKTYLAPYRVVHLAALILLVVRFIPIDWSGLEWWGFRPLIKCGQQSLEVFCVGVFLSFVAHFVLELVDGGMVAQFLVGAAGLSIMTGVAYYRSWSKKVDRAPKLRLHREPGRPS